MKRRLLAAVFVLSLIFSSLPLSVCYAGSEYQENVVDKAGDWFATVGKQGMEKDQILAERKAKRMAHYAEVQAKKASKDAEKAGNDMKKKMGF